MSAGAGTTSSAASPVIGWDVGGAHVKACLLAGGRVADIVQWPAPMWQGLAHLDAAIAAARERWPAFGPARHAVTMTAEMADLFPNREAGVLEIAGRLAERLGPGVRFFAGEDGWTGADEVAGCWDRIASANWLATAQMVGLGRPDALLVDIGSTTTDLIPVIAGHPSPAGRTDAARLRTGELVYLGVVRTPLCAVARRIAFRGTPGNVMNEFFATTADVFRLTGELDPDHDQYPPADGGGKDPAATCQRLARMIGRDAREAAAADWHDLAHGWRHAMVAEIARNLRRVDRLFPQPASRLGAQTGDHPPARDAAEGPATAVPVVGAGCGLFLARALAERLGRPFLPFDALIDAAPGCRKWVATCAPSVAVAVLFGRQVP
ncbi:hydantoinase/oxoprolinase family protein [Thauera sinica]|uniref:Hydantoinase/oxoprolinase family protein n=1 Tax=Thauera sinica TaxID=2665146 RepID=A0ABW1ALF8_9RHOO|nr:hydantoinase/oxoprolinase family protein [Thauera sp. K11]